MLELFAIAAGALAVIKALGNSNEGESGDDSSTSDTDESDSGWSCSYDTTDCSSSQSSDRQTTLSEF